MTELENANLSFESMPKIRVLLSRAEYVIIKTEIVTLTGYPKHSKFRRRKEVPLDSFMKESTPKKKHVKGKPERTTP
ncbi:MAG: hypothetical protein ABI348_11165 [Nitrososphaera sp.]